MPPMAALGARSHWITPLWSVLTGLGFFLLGSLSDLWMQRHVTNLSVALMDDALVGIGAGLLVFLFERRHGRNITALKLADDRAWESEGRFRLVANTAPVLIWTAGTDKLCDYFNQTWLEFTGRALEKEVGNGWTQAVHPDDLEVCVDTYTKAFDLRKSFQMEYRLRRHDGKYRWVLDQGVPRFNPDGSFVGYIGSAVDVTELKLAEEALSGLSRKLIEAQEQERTHIARELHDDIGQRIALLVLNLESAKEGLPASAVEARGRIKETCDFVLELGKDIQSLSHRLHSSKLERLGLEAAAASFCREFSDHQGVEIDFRAEGIPKKIQEEVSLCLFRILQEALQNAAKHSGVKRFDVTLRRESNHIHLVVCDSGVGFDTENAIHSRGIGLTSMRERLKLIGGELSIESQQQIGTAIHARVSLNPITKSAS